VIRYTLDGTKPTLESPVYEEPIAIRSTTELVAQASRPGLLMSGLQRAIVRVEPGDTVSPTAIITLPRQNELVSGSVRVTTRIQDDLAIAGVYFLLDGRRLGGTLTGEGPFETEWDTASVPNGTHVLAVVARDEAGNQTTSAPVAVTVQNAANPNP
jgi:hypothetical protein